MLPFRARNALARPALGQRAYRTQVNTEGARRGDRRGAGDPWRAAVRLAQPVGQDRRSPIRRTALEVIDIVDIAKPPPPPPPPQCPSRRRRSPRRRKAARRPRTSRARRPRWSRPSRSSSRSMPNPVVVAETPRAGRRPDPGRGAGRAARERAPAGLAPAPAAGSADPGRAAAAAAGSRSRRGWCAGSAARDYPPAILRVLAARRGDLPAASDRGQWAAEPVRRRCAASAIAQADQLDLQPWSCSAASSARRSTPRAARSRPGSAIARPTPAAKNFRGRGFARPVQPLGRRAQQEHETNDRSRMVGL